jgi:hypothetical protein
MIISLYGFISSPPFEPSLYNERYEEKYEALGSYDNSFPSKFKNLPMLN